MASIPFGSREYISIPAEVDGPIPVNPSVYAAITERGGAPSTWIPAIWIDSSVRHLLDGALPRGSHAVWVRIDTGTENVIRRAGTLTVY